MNEATQKLLERFEPKSIQVLATQRQVCAARYSPCGKFLLAGSFEGLIDRWNVEAKEAIPLEPASGHHGWVSALGFHPGGSRVFSGDSWGELRCWPYADPAPTATWVVPHAHDGWLRSLAVSPDGEQLATCGRDRIVRLWSSRDGKKIAEMPGHEHDVLCVAFHPDGKSLISGDHAGVVRHWDPASGKCIRQLDAAKLFTLSRLQDVGGVRCLTFDPTGATLGCGGTEPKNGGNVQGVPTVLLFDWKSGQRTRSLAMGKESDVYVFDLHWHKEGFILAVTSGNPGGGQLLLQHPGEPAPFFVTTKLANCHSLSLHPSGARMAVVTTSTGSNGNGRLLNKAGEYVGNTSPIHILEFGKAVQ